MSEGFIDIRKKSDRREVVERLVKAGFTETEEMLAFAIQQLLEDWLICAVVVSSWN